MRNVAVAAVAAAFAVLALTPAALRAEPNVSPSAQAAAEASAQASAHASAQVSLQPVAPPAVALRPDIRVSMSVSPAEAKTGETVTFTVRVSNDGTANSAGVSVLDKFPPQLSNVAWACTAAGATACVQGTGSGSIEMQGVAMATGASLTFVATSSLTQVPASGSVSNQVVAQDNTGGEDADPADNFAQATVRVSALVATFVAAQATVSAGSRVGYTLTLENPGAAAYAGASFASDLSDVLADAVVNNDFQVSDGSTVSYAAPELSWTGSVPAFGKVVITYSVTVKESVSGDQRLDVSVASPGCVDAARCATSIPVLAARIAKSVSKSVAKPGETLVFTVEVTNSSAVEYAGAEFGEDLSGLLDSASFGNDATSSIGTVTYSAPKLTWSGDLPAGSTARITYSVVVSDAGDAMLSGALVPTQRMSCEPCTAEVRIARLVQEISAVPSDGLIRYQIKMMNSGKAVFTGATFVNDLTQVLDDAALIGQPSVTGGTVAFEGSMLTWAGDVAPGETVTLTYTVSIRGGGDGLLRSAISSGDTNCRKPEASCLSTWSLPGAATVDGDENPVTGFSVWKLVSLGLFVINVGLIVVWVSRRRGLGTRPVWPNMR